MEKSQRSSLHPSDADRNVAQEDRIFLNSYIPRHLDQVLDIERDIEKLALGDTESLLYTKLSGVKMDILSCDTENDKGIDSDESKSVADTSGKKNDGDNCNGTANPWSGPTEASQNGEEGAQDDIETTENDRELGTCQSNIHLDVSDGGPWNSPRKITPEEKKVLRKV